MSDARPEPEANPTVITIELPPHPGPLYVATEVVDELRVMAQVTSLLDTLTLDAIDRVLDYCCDRYDSLHDGGRGGLAG